MPNVSSLDHLVLTVADVGRTVRFYEDVLGMEAIRFAAADGTVRHALRFGSQKINLHPAGAEFRPHAKVPAAGTADLCFLTETPLDLWIGHLAAREVPIEEGPVRRTGATGALMSLYLRDPDGNLVEIAAALP